MFGIFSRKKSILESGLLDGFTDHHSHLLPGVDDGFQTADLTLEALRTMEQAGVADVWLTPHIMETSYFRAPIEMRGLIGEMLNAGLHPILAHPERYKYMEQSDYEELKQLGLLFQLNLGSIAGCYSKHTKEKAEWLLENGYYDLMGSDIHNLRFYNHTINEPLPKKVIEAMRQIPNQL